MFKAIEILKHHVDSNAEITDIINRNFQLLETFINTPREIVILKISTDKSEFETEFITTYERTAVFLLASEQPAHIKDFTFGEFNGRDEKQSVKIYLSDINTTQTIKVGVL